MAYADPKDPRLLQKRRQHYHDNPEPYKARSRAATADKREYLRNLKDVPCPDCGQRYHYCQMDFDHVTGTKAFSLNIGAARVGWQRLKDEIAKCEVVCANCHRLRTYERGSAGAPD